jgi:hypothetical protein
VRTAAAASPAASLVHRSMTTSKTSGSLPFSRPCSDSREQAPPVRGQGRLHQSDQRLLHSRADDLPAGSRCDHQRHSAAPSGRDDGAVRPRQPVPLPRLGPRTVRRRPEWAPWAGSRRMRGLRRGGVLLLRSLAMVRLVCAPGTGQRYPLICTIPRAFLPGSMIHAPKANPKSAIPSSVFRPGRS